MAAELIAAGIGAAAGLIGQSQQNTSNEQLNAVNRRWQEKMAKLNYQRNIEMWNMQNAYNTPAQQVKRLRQAGLNPNLLYGNGSAATGNASDISPADVPSSPSSVPYDYSMASNGIANSLALYQNWQINNLNMQKINAERENIDAQTLYTQAMRAGQLTKNKLLGVDLSWADKNYAVDYISKHTGIGKTQSEIFLNNAKKREVELGIYQNAAAFETKLALMQAQIWQARTSSMQAYGNYLESKNRIAVDYYGSQAGLNRSSASLNNQQYSFLDPYYRRGYNPNWSIGQATAASAFNVTKNATDTYNYYDNKFTNSLKKAWNWYKSWNSLDGTPNTFFFKR